MPTPKTYSFTFPAFMTGNATVDSLIAGSYWLGSNWGKGGTSLSYSFMAPGTSYFVTDYSPDNEYNALYELTPGQKAAVNYSLGTWAAVTNLNFSLTTDTLTNVGDLRFGGYRLMDNKTAAWAYFPANTPAGGDVWIGPQTGEATPLKGSYDVMTFIHEIGHALGLKHPFDVSSTNKTLLDPSLDDVHFTVMSYSSNYSYQPTTPMVLDIIAIQSLYGVNTTWQTGDNVYKWAPDQSIFETIWDAGGNDTIDGSNQLASVKINLNEGAYSQIGKAFTDLNTQAAINDGLAIAYGAKIENAIGSAFDDVLIGNALNNTLNGMAGADSMTGGDGNDTYYVDNVGDTVVELANFGSGIDTVVSSLSYTLGNNVENLTLVGTDNLTATGNALNNVLNGNSGNNFIDGGAGADFMAGGAGNDTYIVDNAGDVVSETSAVVGEIDNVLSSVSFTLGANIENLTLTGTGDIFALGNAQNNVLIGNDGNNQLSGAGGLDTMIGGKGNDTYGLDQAGELALIQELAGEGNDTLLITYASTLQTNVVDLNLSNLLNVENATLLGSGNFRLNGNSLNNTLIGNADSNYIDGGAGADVMAGGAGNDIYIVDNVGDVVSETSTLASEIDTVQASISYTLGNNVENLTLTGTDNLNGTGNALNNTLIGNSGNNLLNGGAGADIMIGGAGNDTYIVDNIGDVVSETSTVAGEIDNVLASVSFTLGANIENLTLTGTGDIFALGNSQDNVLIGNDGNNQLSGAGGLDTMIGGKGNDTYGLDQAGELALIQELANEGNDTLLITYAATAQTNVVDLNLSNLRNVENVTLLGSGNFTLTGNSLNNTLTGNADSNIIDGGAGADFMAGGAGNDTYIVDNIGDVVSETSTLASEVDTVLSSVNFTLGANVENLTLTGTGDIFALGNAQNNVLIGNDGNNQLSGGAGLDTMIGGKGNDTYGLDQAGELALIQELANEGTDTLLLTYAATSQVVDLSISNLQNVENVTLLGSGNFAVVGNSLDNVLIGNADNNVLNGGAGADTLNGGAGNDTYVVDNVGDVVIETGTSATEIDQVYSYINYTLGNNVENLSLVGTDNINATGNALNNVLNGNSGNNILDGGAGADFMAGGTGNDTYIVDNAGDVVSETSTIAGEIDTVRSSVNYILGANLENLTLTGTGDVFALGNSQDNVLIGNDGNNQLSGAGGLDTMIGGKGNDTYGLDQAGELALIQELADEGNDTLLLTYAATAQTNVVDLNLSNLRNVENVTLMGSGNFTLTGNSLNNTLIGNADSNIIDGGAGADFMAGGAGNDTYIVDNIGDVVSETSTLASEIDTVQASISYVLGNNLENLSLVGTDNINATGNALNNVLNGNSGNNILDGGAGADFMAGGAGNDTYIVDNAGDVVSETSTVAGEIDTVRSSVNFILGANLENLTLTGTGDVFALGNSQDNVLIGNDGNNQLSGAGGLDTMIGGKGNDTYGLDQAGELALIQELADEGNDTLLLTYAATAQTNVVDLNLSNLRNVENVTLMGSGNFTLTGNSLNNTLIGNADSNIIDGGAGADFMAGGAGNDTYIVDNAGDVVSETSTVAGEIDTVRSSVNYILGANLENLTLTGTGDIFALGNSQDNVLIGNDGNNQLSGAGGLDTMIGGKGNDTYGLDQAGELALIQELANEGTDTLLLTYAATSQIVDLSISNLQNVENVTLLGSGNFAVVGNSLDNVLIGNADNNILNGGAGADTLNGGAGNDTYVVDNVGDVVIETGTSATEIDLVYSYINYTLGNNVENLSLVGTDNINATGNALNNVLNGNSGNNILDGGAGADFMAGGTGNDTYIVDNAGDVVSETSTVAGEIDTVRSSVNYILGANLENLTLTGTGDVFALGNSQDNVLIGNDGNNQLSGAGGLDTMIGGKGNDTYGLDQAGELALIQELADEGNDTLLLTYAATAQTNVVDLNLSNLRNVENVTLLGSGNFTLTGNSLNNTLIGNADSNIIDGGAGADFMAGGAGNDTYIVDNAGDVVSETSTVAGEIDTVRSSVNYTLGANLENLTLTGTGDIFALGNSQDNVLIGNDGNNQLSGGAGLDTMIGGKGNDTYGLDQAGELALIQELANEGTDTLLLTYAATSQIVDLSISNLQNVENVTLLGSGNFAVVGNSLDNVLIGNADNNILNGGAGADTLNGGAGNDTYVVDNVGDVVIETGTSATEIDLVYSYINYTLGNNVENLSLVGTDNINATGNALNNVLNGNSGNNILDGGAGADFMAGGAGNDTYIVDNAGDVVSETSTVAGEIDTVRSSVNFILGANLENLTLTGTGDIFALGNSQDNVLIGNDGNNQLSGAGGLDTMIGGKGNDTYGLDQSGELALIQELANEGNDTLLITYAATPQSSLVDLSISNLVNVENATLLGSGKFALTGNSLNNTLIGNADNNVLNGGAGADTLTGGAGADTFVFGGVNEMGTGSNRDVITDFNSAQGDKIDLTKFDANLLTAGFNGFTFIGAGDFTGAGQLRFVDHVLSGNVSGNTGADFEIQLVGVNNFSATDLVA